MSRVVAVVANPRTSDEAVAGLERALAGEATEFHLVDLRGSVGGAGSRNPVARLFRALTIRWKAARSVKAGDAALISTADVVVAGDALAVATVWLARRQNPDGALVHGVQAALAVLAQNREPQR